MEHPYSEWTKSSNGLDKDLIDLQYFQLWTVKEQEHGMADG